MYIYICINAREAWTWYRSPLSIYIPYAIGFASFYLNLWVPFNIVPDYNNYASNINNFLTMKCIACVLFNMKKNSLVFTMCETRLFQMPTDDGMQDLLQVEIID